MKVVVSSSGKSLDSQIDPRFGRCAYFLIIESDTMDFEAFENESGALGGGAGIQAAQFVISKGAKAVITGNCGPNATQVFSSAGVELYVGIAGTVREGVEKFKKGGVQPASAANVSSHYGMGGGRGMGRGTGMGGGRGMGRGMGMSGGRGMGQGTGMPASDVPPSTGPASFSKGEELKLLKEQAANLARQMEEITARIKKLGKEE